MFYNSSELKSELKTRLKNKQLGDSRLLKWLNEGQDDISILIDCDHLQVTKTFSSTANLKEVYLDFDLNRITSIADTDNDYDLDQVTASEVEDYDPAFSDGGQPSCFYQEGMSYIQRQLTSASTITVVSSSSSDTSQKIRINGKVSSVDDTELLTLNGTSNVTGSKSFTEIYNITKDSDSTGKITITDGSNTLLELGPTDKARQFQRVVLWPTPSSAINYRARGFRKPRAMVNDQDIPDFPSAYHEAVLIAAVARGHDDLFRHAIAQNVREKVLDQKIESLARQMGNRRFKRSVVIGGSRPTRYGGRYPSNYPRW